MFLFYRMFPRVFLCPPRKRTFPTRRSPGRGKWDTMTCRGVKWEIGVVIRGHIGVFIGTTPESIDIIFTVEWDIVY